MYYRGINFALHPSHWPQGNILVDVSRWKAEGLNTMRTIHYMWSYCQPDGPDVINEEGFTSQYIEGIQRLILSIDEFVDLCTQMGMYLIIDLQTSDYYPAPNWAQALGCPPWGRVGTWDFLLSGSVNAKECLRGITNIWAYIASRYAGNDHVIFDIWNEPSIGYLDPLVGKANYKAFMEGCLDAIRANERVRHTVHIPEYFGLRQMGYSDDIIGDRWTYRDTHYYVPGDTDYVRDTHYGMMENDLLDRIDHLTKTGLKIIVGEFGRKANPTASEHYSGNAEWADDVIPLFKAHGVNDLICHWWSHASGMPFSIIYQDGAGVEPYYGAMMSGMYLPPTPTPSFNLAQAFVAGGTAYATTGRPDYALVAGVIGGLIKRKEQG